jgi:hypothetical protein
VSQRANQPFGTTTCHRNLPRALPPPAQSSPAVAPKLAEDRCGFYERHYTVGK